MKQAVNILAAVIALIGLIDSCYLILDNYNLINKQPAMLTDVCPLENGACAIVTESSKSTIWGIPYSVFGGIYFALLLGISLVKLYSGRWPMPRLSMVILAIGLLFSTYLIYVMFYVINEVCPYCLTAHIANAVFFLLFGISLRNDIIEEESLLSRPVAQH